MQITSGFKTPTTKTVQEVEVFAVGEWTDSEGNTYDWTADDLKEMVEAYSNSEDPRVSLKVGHTEDDFNIRIANALGIPVELAMGDENGQGQIALGYVSQLAFIGDKLVADFMGVPEAITDLIEGGQFNAVSSEIDLGHDGSKILSGVALLGVEDPAVTSLAQLNNAKIFGGGKQKGTTIRFALVDNKITPEVLEAEFADISNRVEELIRNKRGSKIFRALWQQMVNNFKGITRQHAENNNNEQEEGMAETITANHQEGVLGPEMTSIAIELGLDESATLGDVLRAIKGLKDQGAEGEGGEGEEGSQMPMSQELSDSLVARVDALEKENTELKHTQVLTKYQTAAADWVGLDGTPDEIAAELTDIEEKLGLEMADKSVARYTKANEAVVNSGILVNHGKSRIINPQDPLDTEMDQWAKDNNTTKAKAMAHFSQNRRSDFIAYMQRTREAQ